MPQDYFSDAAPPAATTPAPDEGSKNAEGKEGESDSQTAVIPTSVLGGHDFAPGEEVVLKVVQVNDDGILVKYASDEKEEEKEPESSPPQQAQAPPPGGGQMSSMLG